MSRIRRALSTRRRLREIIRRREERVLRRLEARARRAFCSWEEPDGEFSAVTHAEDVLTLREVAEVLGRGEGRLEWRRRE